MLLFVQNSAISDNTDDFSVFRPNKISYLKISEFNQIVKEPPASNNLFYLENFTEKRLEEIVKPLYKLDAAGGMIINEKDELLMIFRRGFWDLPKGKTEPDETLENSALRECSEETGLKIMELKEYLTFTHHLYPYIDGFALKKTYWYKFFAPSVQIPVPQTIEDITEAVWLKRNEVKQRLDKSYKMIEYLIRKYYLNGDA